MSAVQAGVTATSASISPPWDKNSNKVDNWQVALRKAKTLVKRGAQPELYAQPVARLDGDRGQTGRSRGESMDAEETSGKPAVDQPLPLSYSTGSEDSHEVSNLRRALLVTFKVLQWRYSATNFTTI